MTDSILRNQSPYFENILPVPVTERTALGLARSLVLA